MIDILTGPWPWYIGGPLIGLMVPMLMFIGNKHFGISSSFRHFCSAVLPLKAEYFKYNWKEYVWSMMMAAGIIIGAVIAVVFLGGDRRPDLSAKALEMFSSWGVVLSMGLQPADIFHPENLFTLQNLILLGGGGFMVGFGTRYAGGCTSGHAIMGLSLLNLGSLVAMISFFLGGILVSNFVMPLILAL